MKIKLNEIKQKFLLIAVLTIVMILTPYSFQKETMSFEQEKTSAATISLLGSLHLDSSYNNGVLTLKSTGLQLANIGLISNYVPVFQLPKEFAGLMSKSNFKTATTISYSIPYIGVGEAVTLNNIGTVTGEGLITNNDTLCVGVSIPHLLGIGIGSPTVFTLSINLKNLGYNELPPSVEGKLTSKAGVFDTVLLEANVLNSTGAISTLATSYVDTVAPEKPYVKPINEKDTELTGTSEPGAVVKATLPDGTQKTTPADSTGKWSIAINPQKANTEVKVTATDAAGNTSGATSVTVAAVVIPDTEAPQQPVIKTIDGETGEISGESEANAKIIVTLPNGNEVMTIASAEGKWSVNITSQTFSRNLLVKAVDAAGNTSESVFATMKATIITEIAVPSTEIPATEVPSEETPATEEPSTEIPATEEPSTETPATEEPSEEAPATEEPSTEIPATEEPSTEIPATEVPSTEIPATEVPSTEIPATEVPSEETPATEEPSTEIPATEVPSEETPATEVPSTEIPATEEPSEETPATEEPSEEAPEAEEPSEEALEAEEPSEETPATEEPSEETPATEEPSTEIPETEVPSEETPATEVPNEETPATEVPSVETPATEEPSEETPETEVPSTEIPETEEPSEETSATEVPNEETPETEVPSVETPATEEPNEETPATEEPSTEMPATEEPSTETPQEQVEMPDTEAPQQPVIKTVDAKTGGITGESEANAKIIVTLPDGSEVTTTADAEGKWTVMITPSRSSMELTIKAVDAAGNSSETVAATMQSTIIPEIETPEVEEPVIEEPEIEIPEVKVPVIEEPETEEPSTVVPQEQVELPDTEAPQQPVIKTVDAKTGVISGESEANAKIIVTLPDGSEVTTTANGEGKWTVKITPSMSSMELRIKAIDAAGNISETVTATMESMIIPVIEVPEIETPEVEVPVIEEPATEEPSTEIPDTEAPQQPVIKTVDAKTGVISGESEANAKIIVSLPDGSEVTTTADAEGKWTVTITPSMSRMELRIKAIDAAGNTSETVTATMESMIIPEIEIPIIETPNPEMPAIETPEVEVPQIETPATEVPATEVPSTEIPQEQVELPDTEAPQQPVIKTVDAKTGEITGESEANAKIIVSLPDGSEVTTTADAEGKWTVTITPSMSSMELRIKAIDAAGNISETVTATMKSTIIPEIEIPIIEAPNPEMPAIETPEVEVPQIETPATEVPSTEIPQEQVELPDTEAPQQPVIKMVDAKTGEITGESEANAKIIVTLPDGSEVTTIADAEGKWTVTTTPSLSSMVVKIKAVDAAGNTSESGSATIEPTIVPEIETPEVEVPNTEVPEIETPEVKVPNTETPQEQVEIPDTKAPQHPVIKTVNEKTGEISGESEANAKIIVTLPDDSEVTTTANNEGKWSVRITPQAFSRELRITSINAAGIRSQMMFATLNGYSSIGAEIVPPVTAPVVVPPTETDSNSDNAAPEPTTVVPSILVENEEIAGTVKPVQQDGPSDDKESGIPGTTGNSPSTPGTGGNGAQAPGTTVKPGTPATNINAGNQSGASNNTLTKLIARDINVNSLEIRGTSDANAFITAVFSDGSKKRTVADSLGNWSISINSQKVNAKIKIIATDAQGNNRMYTFITVMPVLEGTPIKSNIQDSGNVKNNTKAIISNVDNNGIMWITGTSEANATIKLYAADNMLTWVKADANGNWSIPIDSIDRTKKYSVVTTDKSGSIIEIADVSMQNNEVINSSDFIKKSPVIKKLQESNQNELVLKEKMTATKDAINEIPINAYADDKRSLVLTGLSYSGGVNHNQKVTGKSYTDLNTDWKIGSQEETIAATQKIMKQETYFPLYLLILYFLFVVLNRADRKYGWTRGIVQ
ncbi:Ig-like domain-containing protein [Niallia circulans]|nr:Ig-like domain-containing protein [Niallia circulans]